MKPQTTKKPVLEESLETDTTHQSVGGSFKDMGNDIKNSVWEQFFKGMVHDTSNQLLTDDIFSPAKHGEQNAHGQSEMSEGQEIVLKKAQKKAEHVSHHKAEYFKKEVDKDASVEKRQETMIISQRVQEIIMELKQLAQSSSELQIQFQEITTTEVPSEAGTYHIHFFEWMLFVIRSARNKIDSGSSWLAMFASKKKQKGYWNMFKKHGTSFGLSGERNVATQVG